MKTRIYLLIITFILPGCITIFSQDGKASKADIKEQKAFEKQKKNSYSIYLIFMSNAGTYDIHLMVNPEGHADATIRGNWSGQLNYYGRLVPLGISKVYKGMSIF